MILTNIGMNIYQNPFRMTPFMRFRLGTIIRFADPDGPPEVEPKVEANTNEEVIEEENMEEDQEEKPVTKAWTRENDSLRQKKHALKPEQIKFLIDHFNFDKKLVEADGGRYLLQAMRSVLERKQEQLQKTEKQIMIFENLTTNNYSE